MTTEQKNTVIALRQQGYGYLKIANQLGITVGSVKSFCQRNGLRESARAEIPMIDPNTVTHLCKQCGAPFVQTTHTKKKLFCSTACRQKWWNAHLDQVDRKANYEFTCLTCGKEFTAYGNKNRKYCCHECYIADRFGRVIA